MPLPTEQNPQTDQSRTPAPAGTQSADEHFAHLHKMSTTAGVGSGDYVAVNIPSVVAILLGIASSLSLLDPVFLVIPVAGLVCAVMALMQIRKSSGTQTGTLLAIGGIGITLLFSGLVGYRQLNEYLSNSRESAAIVSTITQFETDAKSSNWTHAYTLMGPRFKEKTNEKTFTEFFSTYEASRYYGHITSIVWNGNLLTFTDPASGGRYARAVVRIGYSASAETRTTHEILFHLVNGEWKMEELSSFFGAQQFN